MEDLRSSSGYYDTDAGRPVRRYGFGSRVLLREPEACAECNKVYLSLYPLRSCSDHDGLEKI